MYNFEKVVTIYRVPQKEGSYFTQWKDFQEKLSY